MEGRPTVIGAVLGSILRDDVRADASRRDAAVRSAAWLAERPDKEPLLLDDVLRRARDDAEFPRLVRAALAPQSAGWGRLAEGARKRARDAAAAIEARLGAVRFLAEDPSMPSAEALLDVWAGGAGDELRRDARVALDSVLAFRFADLEAARRWFDGHRSMPFLDALRELSASKDTPQYPAYLRLISEAKGNLERT